MGFPNRLVQLCKQDSQHYSFIETQNSDTNLAKIYKHNETPRYADPMYTQTSSESGERNENRSGGCLIGLANKMLIPVEIDYKFHEIRCYVKWVTKRHKWHSKVYSGSSFICYSKVTNSHISFLHRIVTE